MIMHQSTLDPTYIPSLPESTSLVSNDYFGNLVEVSPLVGKPTMWFPNRSDTKRAVQSQKQARSLKFQI